MHASSGTTGQPTVVGYTQDDLDMWADLMARSIRAAGGRRGDIVHVAYGYGLFTGGLGAHYGAERLGCTVVPISGGMTPRQVQLIRDFQPVDHHGHAVIHARAHRRVRAPGRRPEDLLVAHRHLRRGALDRGDAWRDRAAAGHARGGHLRAVRGDGTGRVPGMRRDQGWPARLGGPFLPGGDRPGERRGASGRGDRRAGVHVIDQAGAADHSLPDPRSHAAAARHGASGFPAHGEGHGAERRHDHPARCQRLSHATRGARRRAPAASRRTSS